MGFIPIQNNKGMIPYPTITIVENQNEKLYRLPLELNDWAYDMVGMAHDINDLFPSDVEFCNINGIYTADLL